MPVKPIKLYTKNGNRLISSTNNNATREKFTKIETDFGKGITTVETTFDNFGKPLKIIIKKKKKKNLEKIIMDFEGVYNVRRKTKIKRFLNHKHISTTVKSEILTNSDNKPFLTRTVFTTTPLKNDSRKETQIIEELSTNKHRRYIKTTAIRNKQGKLSKKSIQGNINNLKKLNNSIYLFFRSYSLKDFLISIIPHAKNLQKVSKRDIQYQFETLNKKVAANSRSIDGFGTITFDMDKMISKSFVIETVNHEYRHQYQDKIIEEFNLEGIKGLIKKVFSPLKYKYAKKCAHAKKNYVSYTENEAEYRKNFLETDARLAASKARKEYLHETALLDEIFPHSKELFTGNDEFFRIIMRSKNTK